MLNLSVSGIVTSPKIPGFADGSSYFVIVRPPQCNDLVHDPESHPTFLQATAGPNPLIVQASQLRRRHVRMSACLMIDHIFSPCVSDQFHWLFDPGDAARGESRVGVKTESRAKSGCLACISVGAWAALNQLLQTLGRKSDLLSICCEHTAIPKMCWIMSRVRSCAKG